MMKRSGGKMLDIDTVSKEKNSYNKEGDLSVAMWGNLFQVWNPSQRVRGEQPSLRSGAYSVRSPSFPETRGEIENIADIEKG